jgi:hypothetical protein
MRPKSHQALSSNRNTQQTLLLLLCCLAIMKSDTGNRRAGIISGKGAPKEAQEKGDLNRTQGGDIRLCLSWLIDNPELQSPSAHVQKKIQVSWGVRKGRNQHNKLGQACCPPVLFLFGKDKHPEVTLVEKQKRLEGGAWVQPHQTQRCG